MLSASWEVAMSHMGEIDHCCDDGHPIPHPTTATGIAAGGGAAGQQAIEMGGGMAA
jgi:hypothetical protein